MMNLKILRLTGVASALSAISLTQAAEEASPKTDGKIVGEGLNRALATLDVTSPGKSKRAGMPSGD
jgi:hypothetical protein